VSVWLDELPAPASQTDSCLSVFSRHRFTWRQTRCTFPIMFLIELVQASERRSGVGSLRRVTVSSSRSRSWRRHPVPPGRAGGRDCAVAARLSCTIELATLSKPSAERSARGLAARTVILRALWGLATASSQTTSCLWTSCGQAKFYPLDAIITAANERPA
jgi:hypothetical protein